MFFYLPGSPIQTLSESAWHLLTSRSILLDRVWWQNSRKFTTKWDAFFNKNCPKLNHLVTCHELYCVVLYCPGCVPCTVCTVKYSLVAHGVWAWLICSGRPVLPLFFYLHFAPLQVCRIVQFTFDDIIGDCPQKLSWLSLFFIFVVILLLCIFL